MKQHWSVLTDCEVNHAKLCIKQFLLACHYFAILFQSSKYFWTRITNDCSKSETSVWYILFIESVLKWYIHLNRCPFLYFNHINVWWHHQQEHLLGCTGIHTVNKTVRLGQCLSIHPPPFFSRPNTLSLDLSRFTFLVYTIFLDLLV